MKTGIKEDVQRVVEKPELHIIARARSNHEQYAYIQSRQECIDQISEDKTNKVRFFKGDKPA